MSKFCLDPNRDNIFLLHIVHGDFENKKYLKDKLKYRNLTNKPHIFVYLGVNWWKEDRKMLKSIPIVMNMSSIKISKKIIHMFIDRITDSQSDSRGFKSKD